MTQVISDTPSVEPVPLVQQDPPDAAWVDAAQQWEDGLHTFDEQLAAHYRQWQRTVQRRLVHPYHTTLKRLARLHHSLMQSVLPEEGEAPDAETYWLTVCEYRHAVYLQIIEPLRKQLERLNPGHHIGLSFDQFIQQAHSAVDAFPETLTLPVPEAHRHRMPTDTRSQRFYKALRRIGHQTTRLGYAFTNSVRKLFKKGLKARPAQAYTVPVRQLVHYHVATRVGAALTEPYEATQQQLAQYLLALEQALTTWTNDVLMAEYALDRSPFHYSTLFDATESGAASTQQSASRSQITGIADIATALQDALETASTSPAAVPDSVDLWPGLHDAIQHDVCYYGTALSSVVTYTLPPAYALPAAHAHARQHQWYTWHEHVQNRLLINIRLLTLRERIVMMRKATLVHITEAVLRPTLQSCTEMATVLHRIREEVIEACTNTPEDGDLSSLRSTLEDLSGEVNNHMQRYLQALTNLAPREEVFEYPGKTPWKNLHLFVQALPGAVRLHGLPSRPLPLLAPDVEPITIDLRALVQNVLVLTIPERLHTLIEPLRKQVTRGWLQAERIQHIVQYNFDAALDELLPEEADAPGPSDAAPPPTPAEKVHTAEQLITEGLGRSINTLNDLLQHLATPWDNFAETTFKLIQEDWHLIHQRMRTDVMSQEQWAGLRARVQRRLTHLQGAMRERRIQYGKTLQRYLRFGRRRAVQLIRKSQEAVGVGDRTDTHLFTLDALQDITDIQKQLPLVYRKLFALEPVQEGALMSGRSTDIERLADHYARWQKGRQAGVLILTSPLGSGRTSFFNVLADGVLANATVHRCTLETRLLAEASLAGILAKALDITLPDTPSLDTLEGYLLNQPRPAHPKACLIDNLEHLLLRIPGGTTLIERMLMFLSRTDTRIYWVLTMSEQAWRFLTKSAMAASGYATPHTLTPFNRTTLEELITDRHRRSGMVLRFTTPTDLSPIMRQRLRRAKTPDAEQDILREAYFDQLFRLAGQNVMLAIFYWIRCVALDPESDTLTVAPIRSLDFRFFSSFDLARAFTLKAFIVHNTLSLAEHNRIFRMTDEESTFILESLLNLHIIEPSLPAHRLTTSLDYGRIASDDRYRLHPMMIHPITEYLKGKHIIY